MAHNAVGMLRKVDAVGRVVVPIELYRQFSISGGDEVENTATEDGILIRKYDKNDIKADIRSVIDKYEYDGINTDMVKDLKKLIEN